MVRLKLLSLATLFIVSAGLLQAQDSTHIPKADLSIPFGTVSGKILIGGDYLVFIDEEKPESSIVIPRAAVQNVSSQDKTVSLELTDSVRDRTGERSQLMFRVATDSEVASITRWSGKRPVLATRTKTDNLQGRKLAEESRSAGSSVKASVTIPRDTIFQLQMNQGISSRTAQTGDTFTASVMAPVTVGNVVAVPKGSLVHGRVTEVMRAERRKSGTIAVAFYELELPSKETFPIYGSLTSLSDEQGERREAGQEGEVRGKSTTKRDVVFIGGGAGAIIGGVAGGGKGAGVGAAIGAGLGTLGALISEGNEVEVSSGTEIAMVLDREVTVPASR